MKNSTTLKTFTLLLSMLFISFTYASASEITDSTLYKTLNYRDFKFEVPQQCTSEGSIPLVVKSPDGAFGVSLEIGDSQGANVKRCHSFCADLARNLHLKNIKIEDVRINGLKGSLATGEVENQMISILVLIKGEKQVRAILMYSPNHKDWAEHTIKSFKKGGN